MSNVQLSITSGLVDPHFLSEVNVTNVWYAQSQNMQAEFDIKCEDFAASVNKTSENSHGHSSLGDLPKVVL